MNYEQWVCMAISKTGSLQKGTIFLLKDLFNGIQWSKLNNGERRELGRQFKHKVTSGIVPKVIYIGKAQNNSAQYQKE